MKKTILTLIFIFITGSIFSQKNRKKEDINLDSILNEFRMEINSKISFNNNNNDLEFKSLISKLNEFYSETNQLNNSLLKNSEIIDNLKDSIIKVSSDFKTLFSIISSNQMRNDKNVEYIFKNIDSLYTANDYVKKILDSSSYKIKNNLSKASSNAISINEIDKEIQKKEQSFLYSFIFFLLLILVVTLYFYFNNRKILASQKQTFEKQLDDSQKIAEWLEQNSAEKLKDGVSSLDHSFAKRVADEIVRMSTNLSRMDDSIRGYKQLSASVRKLKQSLSVNDYEIIELINKPYNDGMNIEANFIYDEKLKKGEQVITRIIKPQINYKGKMIQSAQVEVSQND